MNNPAFLDEKIIDIALIANQEIWKVDESKQLALIQKFGSKEKAMDKTFYILVDGIRKALSILD